MDFFKWVTILPFILLKLLIRTTYSTPTIFTTSIYIANTIDNKFQEMTASLFWELFDWIQYILAPILWTLILCGGDILQTALYIPRYAWDLFWHKDGRSLFRMLKDPEGKLDDQNHHPCRGRKGWRKNDNLCQQPRQHCVYYPTRAPSDSITIVGYDSRLCMFSHYQMNRENMNRCDHGGPQ